MYALIIRAEINKSPIEESLDIPIIRVGNSPVFSVLVSVEHEPILRIVVGESDESECYAFEEALIWQLFVVIGVGHRVYFVALDDHSIRSIDLGAYFGHFYETTDYLLAASCDRLFCFNTQGEIVWKSEQLAVDGVLVHDIRDGMIYGDAEHDPPGDWRPFQLRLSDGVVIDPLEKGGTQD